MSDKVTSYLLAMAHLKVRGAECTELRLSRTDRRIGRIEAPDEQSEPVASYPDAGASMPLMMPVEKRMRRQQQRSCNAS